MIWISCCGWQTVNAKALVPLVNCLILQRKMHRKELLLIVWMDAHIEMNVLSMHALIGAYKPEGYEWVEKLRETISGNVNFACDYITQHFEGVSVSKPEGTYMLFLDCTDWCKAHGKTIAEVEKAGWNVGVAWQDGRMFHGPCAIRMNLALPLTRVQEAFERLDKYVFNGEWV